MAELPRALMHVNHPTFFHFGVDYFGPLLVKQGRSEVKRYECMFTCMTSQTVHLEVAHSLSSDSFISALSRFISRRGSVSHIYSDNGSNFVGADRILKESIKGLNQNQISQFLLRKEIDWHFNTPLASHFGGTWEHLIRSVRRVMGTLAPYGTLNDENLHTLLVEQEGILNSRPLTPVTFAEKIDRPLTPYDLLLLSPDMGLPVTETASADAHFKNRWKQIQLYADVFWERRLKEYMPTLIPRQK